MQTLVPEAALAIWKRTKRFGPSTFVEANDSENPE
jgi:hypothetical protein